MVKHGMRSTLPDGWLTEPEAAELQRLARGKTVLELGAWKGRSTVVLAEAAKYVVSVDRHQGIAEVGGEDSLPDYLASVRRLANVAVVIADFHRFVPLLRESFDLVYVDGDHDTDSVVNDGNLAMWAAKDDGIVAFHDFDFESVQRGVHDLLGEVPDGLVGSLAWFQL